jgi:3-oxoacyl-[acyl-carrier protein] reductase
MISSVSARMGVAQQSVYAASKAGTEALARVWATELGQSRGITVNCVNPGPVSTEMFRANAPEFIESLKPMINSTPAGARLGETDDIAPLVRYVRLTHLSSNLPPANMI